MKKRNVGAGPVSAQNGITLIALIITIIVMMILVAVTVTFTVGENGILAQAKQSAKLAERAQLHEQIMGAMKLTNEGKIIVGDSYEAAKELLESQGYEVGDLNEADGKFEVTGEKGTYTYKITETKITIEENFSAGNGPESVPATTIAEAMQGDMLQKKVNSDIEDQYGNKITIPAGFKILVDNTTTYTETTIDVTDGIVVTDGTNEFVWVPVGEDITNGEKTANITLGRYSNFVANDQGEYIPEQSAENKGFEEIVPIDYCAEYQINRKNCNSKKLIRICNNNIRKRRILYSKV